MDNSVISKLKVVGGLLPLIRASLTAAPSHRVFAFDASETGYAVTQRFVNSPFPFLRAPERARFRQERNSSVSARAAALIIPEVVDPRLSFRPSLDGGVCQGFVLEEVFSEIPRGMCDFPEGRLLWCATLEGDVPIHVLEAHAMQGLMS